MRSGIRVVQASLFLFSGLAAQLAMADVSLKGFAGGDVVYASAPVTLPSRDSFSATLDGGSTGTAAPSSLSLLDSTGFTDANVIVAGDPSKLQAGTVTARLVISFPHGQPSVTQTVTFQVSSAAPSPEFLPNVITLSGVSGDGFPVSAPLFIHNATGGPQPFTATLNGANVGFLTVTPTSGITSQNAPSLTVQDNKNAPTKSKTGAYSALLHVTSGSFAADVPVTFLAKQDLLFFQLSQAGLYFKAQQGVGTPVTQTISLLVASTALSFTASVSSTTDFVTVTPTNASVNPGSPGKITIGVKPLTTPGVYYALVTITPTSFTTSISPVSLTVVYNVTANAPDPELLPAGLVFASGATAPPAQNINIAGSSTGTFPYEVGSASLPSAQGGGNSVPSTAQSCTADGHDASWSIISSTIPEEAGTGPAFCVKNQPGPWYQPGPGANWIGPGPDQATVQASAGTVTYGTTFNIATPASASFQMSISGDEDYQVLLNGQTVAKSSGPTFANPAGVTVNSGFVSGLNTLRIVVNSSGGSNGLYIKINQQAGGGGGTTTSSGFINVPNPTGNASGRALTPVAISVDPTGLKQGIYRGHVQFNFPQSGTFRLADVLQIVLPAGVTPPSGNEAMEAAPAAACTPSQIAIVGTTMAGNFSQPAGWPAVVHSRVVDDCANAVTNAKVVISFSNGDPPLAASLEACSAEQGCNGGTAGTYAATWVSSHTGPVTMTMRASSGGMSASATYSGGITANAAPAVSPNGTVNNLFVQAGAPLAPGTIAAIYGSGLAAGPPGSPGQVPLPSNFQGTSVVVGGLNAPFYYASDGQLNVQLPAELNPNQTYALVVTANGQISTPQNITVGSATPGVAAFADGRLIAQHLDFTLVDANHPAKAGETIVMYLDGMGPTNPAVPTGTAAPSSPLAQVTNTATVLVDGNPANVFFAGLTPGAVGLYQIDFTIPGNARSGNLTVTVTQNGTPANSTTVPVVAQ